MAANILITGAKCEQTDDFTFQLVSQVGLMLFDDLWLKSSSAVTWCIELKAAGSAFDGFRC